MPKQKPFPRHPALTHLFRAALRPVALGAMLAASVVLPASAKNFAFPKNNPVATVVIPDSWKTTAIDYGFEAKSPGEDIYFSIESAGEKGLDAMMDVTASWMKDNNIKPKGKAEEHDLSIAGMNGKILVYKCTDDNGDTEVDLILLSSGNRIIMMTMWGSEKEQQDHKAELDAIMQSVRAIAP